MADVLRAVEHPESQAAEKVPRAEVPRDRPDLEAGLLLEILIDVVQLRDVVGTEVF